MQVILESVLIPDSESRIKNGREGYGRRRWRKPRPPSPGISRRSEEADLIIDKGKWEVGMSKRAKLRLQEKLVFAGAAAAVRSEEHTSELKSLMRISYAVFCLRQTKTN